MYAIRSYYAQSLVIPGGVESLLAVMLGEEGEDTAQAAVDTQQRTAAVHPAVISTARIVV